MPPIRRGASTALRTAAAVRRCGDTLLEQASADPNRLPYGSSAAPHDPHPAEGAIPTEAPHSAQCREAVAELSRAEVKDLASGLTDTQLLAALQALEGGSDGKALGLKLAVLVFDRSEALGPHCALAMGSLARIHACPATLADRLAEIVLLEANLARLTPCGIACVVHAASSLGHRFATRALFPEMALRALSLRYDPPDLHHLLATIRGVSPHRLPPALAPRFVTFVCRRAEALLLRAGERGAPLPLTPLDVAGFARNVIALVKNNNMGPEGISGDSSGGGAPPYAPVLSVLAKHPGALRLLPKKDVRTVVLGGARHIEVEVAATLIACFAPDLSNYPDLTGGVSAALSQRMEKAARDKVSNLPFMLLLRHCTSDAFQLIAHRMSGGAVDLGVSWFVAAELCRILDRREGLVTPTSSSSSTSTALHLLWGYAVQHITSLPTEYGISAAVDTPHPNPTTPHLATPGLICGVFLSQGPGRPFSRLALHPGALQSLYRLGWGGSAEMGDVHLSATLRAMSSSAVYCPSVLREMAGEACRLGRSAQCGMRASALLVESLAACCLLHPLRAFAALLLRRMSRDLGLGGLSPTSFNTGQVLRMSAALLSLPTAEGWGAAGSPEAELLRALLGSAAQRMRAAAPGVALESEKHGVEAGTAVLLGRALLGELAYGGGGAATTPATPRPPGLLAEAVRRCAPHLAAAMSGCGGEELAGEAARAVCPALRSLDSGFATRLLAGLAPQRHHRSPAPTPPPPPALLAAARSAGLEVPGWGGGGGGGGGARGPTFSLASSTRQSVAFHTWGTPAEVGGALRRALRGAACPAPPVGEGGSAAEAALLRAFESAVLRSVLSGGRPAPRSSASSSVEAVLLRDQGGADGVPLPHSLVVSWVAREEDGEEGVRLRQVCSSLLEGLGRGGRRAWDAFREGCDGSREVDLMEAAAARWLPWQAGLVLAQPREAINVADAVPLLACRQEEGYEGILEDSCLFQERFAAVHSHLLGAYPGSYLECVIAFSASSM